MLNLNSNPSSRPEDIYNLPEFTSDQLGFVKEFNADQYFGLDQAAVDKEATPVEVKSTKSWFGKACTYVKSQLTIDNLSKISLIVTAALATSLLCRTGDRPFDRQLEETGRDFSAFYLFMTFAYIANNKLSKAAKKFAIAAALTHLVNYKVIRLELSNYKYYGTWQDFADSQFKLSQYKQLGTLRDLVSSQDELSEYKHYGTWQDFASTQRDSERAWEKNDLLKEEVKDLKDEVKDLNFKIGECKANLNYKESELQQHKYALYAANSKSEKEQPVYSTYEWIKSFIPYGTSKDTKPSSVSEEDIMQMQITFGTTYIAGNPQRDALSEMVAKTHEEYAKRWKLVYNPVTENLLVGKCDRSYYDTEQVDCVPYWNKIAVLQNCLNKPKIHKEEWCAVVDDDMPVTNMKVDPRDAINLLRRGVDSSVIVARDVSVWNGDPNTAVNTGALFVRKDVNGKDVVNRIWEKRNDKGTGSEVCRTLGTCKNQDTLHEQQAMADLLKENPNLLQGIVTVVMPRDTYEGQEIALNTFERSGCFIRKQDHWSSSRIDYFNSDRHYPEGAWRIGDWLGQTAGVPIYGWYCGDYNDGKPPGPIREDKLKKMIEKTVR